MIAKAIELNGHGDRLRFFVNDRPDLDQFPNGGFDLVDSSITLQHIPPRYCRAYIQEFFRVLRPGGAAVFQVRNGPRVEPGSLRAGLYRLNREYLRHVLQKLKGQPPYEIHFIARSQVEELIVDSGARLAAIKDVGRGGRGRSFHYCALTPCPEE